MLNRAAGTVLGAVVFAGFAAVLPRPEGLIALVAISGALIPVATRHFAAQTAVVTVLVLALVMVGGEPQASVSRIAGGSMENSALRAGAKRKRAHDGIEISGR